MNFLGNFGDQLFDSLSNEYGYEVNTHLNGDWLEYIIKQKNLLLVLQFHKTPHVIVFRCFVENENTECTYDLVDNKINDINNYDEFKNIYLSHIMFNFGKILFVKNNIDYKLSEIYDLLEKELYLEISSIHDLVIDFPIID